MRHCEKPEFMGIFFRCLLENKTDICGILALVVVPADAFLSIVGFNADILIRCLCFG